MILELWLMLKSGPGIYAKLSRNVDWEFLPHPSDGHSRCSLRLCLDSVGKEKILELCSHEILWCTSGKIKIRGYYYCTDEQEAKDLCSLLTSCEGFGRQNHE